MSEIIIENIKDQDYSFFDCENNSLNNYLKYNAYYEHVKRLANSNIIKKDGNCIGYFTISMVIVNIEEQTTQYPCLYLKYICIDKDNQGQGIGTKILQYIAKESLKVSKFVGCRCLLLDAIKSKIPWYANHGFVILDHEELNTFSNTVTMYMDFRDDELYNDLFEV